MGLSDPNSKGTGAPAIPTVDISSTEPRPSISNMLLTFSAPTKSSNILRATSLLVASTNTNLRSLAWNWPGSFPSLTLGILLYKSDPFSFSAINKSIYSGECSEGSTAVPSGGNNSTPCLMYFSAPAHLFQSQSLELQPRNTPSPTFKGPSSPTYSYAALIGDAWVEISTRTFDIALVNTFQILRESSAVISRPFGSFLPLFVGRDINTITSSALSAYFRTISRCPL